MKIYFCEKCGVSIPLQEVVGGRATARDGKTYCQGCHPGGDVEGGDLKLYFCDNCRVSIPLQDVITNRAKAVGEQMLCLDCSRLNEGQRSARRDRIQREMKEKEEGRYRLHFCDSCNTSIPQSHLITGRAVIRGGRTFCERCRGRAEGRRVSALATVSVLLLLAVVFVAGYVLLGSGGGLLAGEAKKAEAGPDPMLLLENRVVGLEDELGRRAEEISKLRGSLEALPDIREEQERLGDLVDGNRRQAKEILEKQNVFKSDADERAARLEDVLRQLEGRLAALNARLDELEKAPPGAAAPAAPAPAAGGGPKVAPPPPPTPAEVPEEVKTLISDLKNDDAGVRFSAAVELGKKGNKAAVDPLIEILKEDRDVFVRRAAIRSLGDLNAWRAVPVLIDCLEDKELFVTTTASDALEKITGQDFGLKEGLSRSEVRRVVQKAKDWWEEHKNERGE